MYFLLKSDFLECPIFSGRSQYILFPKSFDRSTVPNLENCHFAVQRWSFDYCVILVFLSQNVSKACQISSLNCFNFVKHLLIDIYVRIDCNNGAWLEYLSMKFQSTSKHIIPFTGVYDIVWCYFVIFNLGEIWNISTLQSLSLFEKLSNKLFLQNRIMHCES